MRKLVLFVFILIAASVVFFSYFTLLISWADRFSIDMHSPDHLKTALESAALVAYIYLGIKFFNRHLGSLR